MHRFWPLVSELLKTIDAGRICEIGADHGLHTALLIEHCAERDAFLEVVDPLPKFDVEQWQVRCPAVWALHRSPSTEALPSIDPCDVYLIDGDHNWYTVTRELELIHDRAPEDRRPLVLLHDTAWPYGRRDLYYAPERIPEEYRHPYERKPLLPGLKGLAEHGINADLCNAIEEGAARSGVLGR